ncbi:Glutathione S-transferase DHAR2 [Porphyridium purpureum]|uniref:Glutathione S-transferase DHAR2 n=1 Tax=Porphyridium purpureum TaxID=35688 RepID=A0A5J4YNE5_PORPP|nr:Glutathione S-transferase DHAR2 [Porphyridium purpureum]|eukprot:POR3247..scf249_10
MALALKKVDYQRVLIDTANKPDWYMRDVNPHGTVPTLQVRAGPGRGDGVIITDSEQACAFIDDKAHSVQLGFAEEIVPELAPKNLDEHQKQRLNDVIGGVFPAFAACVKNTEEAKVDELAVVLESKLTALNDYLVENKPSMFLCGDTPTTHDCNLAPKLYHLRVVGSHLPAKKIRIPEKCAALSQYIRDIEAHPAFQETCYPEAVVMAGWSKFL